MESRSNPDGAPISGQGYSPNYRVLVLRLWRQDQGATWRLTVQEVGEAGRRSFPDLDSFMAHLLWLIAEPRAAQQGSRKPDDADNVDDANDH